MITVFTAPKPFKDEHIARIQRNAIRSWLALGNRVEVLLLGDEPGLKETAEDLGLTLMPINYRSASGAPRIDELFSLARENASHTLLAYLNADIILLDDILPSVSDVDERFDQFLMVGNRWDIDIRQEIAFDGKWISDMRALLRERGRKHPPMGSDYFVFRKGQFKEMPGFALGRAGWDNWMMYKARHEGWPLIDATERITAIHQDHDYGHLPGGQPHYRHPESARNIELAGGYEAMFRLRDANWLFTEDGLRRKRMFERSWPRKVEADLIASFGTGTAAKLTRMAFHPGAAAAYLRHKFKSNAGAPKDQPRDPEVAE